MEISKEQFDKALINYAESLKIIEAYTKQVFSAQFFETPKRNKYKSFSDLVKGNWVEVVELHNNKQIEIMKNLNKDTKEFIEGAIYFIVAFTLIVSIASTILNTNPINF